MIRQWCKAVGVNLTDITLLIYIDRLLLVIYEKSGFGCHINNTYMGALSYADHITISYPGLYGLNIMLDICNNFAHDNCITFNKK